MLILFLLHFLMSSKRKEATTILRSLVGSEHQQRFEFLSHLCVWLLKLNTVQHFVILKLSLKRSEKVQHAGFVVKVFSPLLHCTASNNAKSGTC
jgi:hypothetical protein